jgi:nucleoside 2-deoxyribosyltransferase
MRKVQWGSAMRVYLAGPEVFLPDAVQVGERKKEICRKYGLTAHFPLDAGIDLEGLPPQEGARLLFRANIAAIDDSDAMIANMAPFRGPGLDGGTAFEMGYAAAIGIPIYAYTNDPRTYLGRARSLGLVARVDEDGRSRDEGDMEIEDFGLVDNLMLACAAHELVKPMIWRGGTGGSLDLDTGFAMFEAAVQKLARTFD